jgi:hypothetical protein
MAIFNLLWSILFIIPGIVMSIYYSMSIWAYLCEDFTGTKALKRSKELVKNYWWQVLSRILAPTLIYLILVTPLYFINDVNAKKVYSTIIQFFSIIITPFFVAYSFMIFLDLKRLKGESEIANRQGNKLVSCSLLVVVILIIFGLPTFAILSLNNTKTKLSGAKDMSDFKQVQTALEIYYSDHERYPFSLSELKKSAFLLLDEETLAKFRYSINDNNYKLCFDFKEGSGMYEKGENCVKSNNLENSEPNADIDSSYDKTWVGDLSATNSNPVIVQESRTSSFNNENLIGSVNSSSTTVAPPPDPSTDSDNDNLTDNEELKYGTDLHNPDTDGDGFKDGDEIRGGYNPLGPGRLVNKN